MRTIKSYRMGNKRLLNTGIVLAVVLIAFGCSKDDASETENAIVLGKPGFSFDGNCDHSTGTVGTRVLFELPYTSSSGLSIDKVKVKIREGSNGLEDDEIEISFELVENAITTNSCTIFDNNDWYEYTYQLIGDDGGTNNPVTIRVNRPDGAN